MTLVELYILDKYTGLHRLETAKEIIWDDRGFCRLDKSITKQRLTNETNIDIINSWMSNAKLEVVHTF